MPEKPPRSPGSRLLWAIPLLIVLLPLGYSVVSSVAQVGEPGLAVPPEAGQPARHPQLFRQARQLFAVALAVTGVDVGRLQVVVAAQRVGLDVALDEPAPLLSPVGDLGL